MLIIDKFPPGPTDPPVGWHRCAARSCCSRLPIPGRLCKAHPDATPGDLAAGQSTRILFPANFPAHPGP